MRAGEANGQNVKLLFYAMKILLKKAGKKLNALLKLDSTLNKCKI